MQCNWELFELRVALYFRGEKNKTGGDFTGQVAFEFFNVMPDLNSLALGEFKGTNNGCNFLTVFNEMVKMKVMPFSFPSERIKADRLNFGNLQALERNNRTLRAGKLYVHRRDQSDHTSFTTGIGMLIESVSILFTAAGPPQFYASLSGSSANLVNA